MYSTHIRSLLVSVVGVHNSMWVCALGSENWILGAGVTDSCDPPDNGC